MARKARTYSDLLYEDVPARAVHTRAEAAEWAHVHVNTIDRARKNGALKSTNPGGGRPVRIAHRDLLRWLGLLVVLVLSTLLLVELVDVVVAWGGDWGFPPGTGHPLEALGDWFQRRDW